MGETERHTGRRNEVVFQLANLEKENIKTAIMFLECHIEKWEGRFILTQEQM